MNRQSGVQLNLSLVGPCLGSYLEAEQSYQKHLLLGTDFC